MSKLIDRYNTIIIGGGQAGLVTGYYLKQQNHNFVILDANERTGDSWRKRWDSLRLFTLARYNQLPGMPFPAASHTFPTKDSMADYLEAYAAKFELPIRTGVRVDSLSKEEDRFVVNAGDQRYEANNVVIAMANYQQPRIPSFAGELNPDIIQLHSSDYRNPSQLKDGDVLIVGAGNSGAEIALEVTPSHPTWLAGKYPGYIPFRIETKIAFHLLIPFVRFLYHHVLNINTPIGRKVRPKMLNKSAPLVRTKPKDLDVAGVKRAPRIVGVRDGLPKLEDGRVLNVANIVWCTGFHPGFSWIDMPIFGEDGKPLHERGIVTSHPGLYFVGLHFLTAISSAQINGVARDAKYITDQIVAHTRTSERVQLSVKPHEETVWLSK